MTWWLIAYAIGFVATFIAVAAFVGREGITDSAGIGLLVSAVLWPIMLPIYLTGGLVVLAQRFVK